MKDDIKTETQELAGSDTWLMQYYTEDKDFDDDAASPEMEELALNLSICPTEKYEVEHVIGEGGMKTVFTAIDHDSHRKVAMAVLNRESKPSVVRRFVREARITAMLEHPNIVPIHDVGVNDEEEPYFVMKYVEGENLSSILKKLRDGVPKYRRKYKLNDRLDIFQRVCNATAFAHSKGVLHLDLKPSNIQVSDFGEVLVVDWGIAKILSPPEGQLSPELKEMSEEEMDRTRDGTMKGSPGFMAPEQAVYNQNLKDCRTDIYALGAILYSILTWKLHSTGTSVDQVVNDTIAGNIVPPRLRAPDRIIPAALEAITMKALARKPEQRYQKVEELLSDLKAFRGGYVTSAENLGPLGILKSLILRHKMAAALVAAALVTAATLGAISIKQIKNSEQEAHDSLRRLAAGQEETKRALQESLESLQKVQVNIDARKMIEAENKRIGAYAAPRLVEEAEELLQRLDFELANTKLEEAIAWQAGNREGKIAKAYVHLGKREFSQAKRFFDEARVNPEDVFPGENLIPKYWDGEVTGIVNLGSDELLEFFNDVWNSKKLNRMYKRPIAALLLGEWNRIYGLDDGHMMEVMRAVQTMNPKFDGPDPEFYERDATGLRVYLSNSINIQHLLPLFGLPLIHLDLHETKVRDLDFMKGMVLLEHLDLSNTTINNIDVLYDLPLRHLNLKNCRRLKKIDVARFRHLENLVVSPRMEKFVKAHIQAGNSSPRVDIQ